MYSVSQEQPSAGLLIVGTPLLPLNPELNIMHSSPIENDHNLKNELKAKTLKNKANK